MSQQRLTEPSADTRPSVNFTGDPTKALAAVITALELADDAPDDEIRTELEYLLEVRAGAAPANVAAHARSRGLSEDEVEVLSDLARRSGVTVATVDRYITKKRELRR